jgi:glucan phosphoethanolaminetransferase (alkaline phosphatase superfamily)
MNGISLVAFGLVFAGPALMALGLFLVFASLVGRHVGSPIGARLLLLGPGVSMIGAALVITELEFDPFVRAVLILVLLASGVAVCVAALRARIRFTPIKPTQLR